MAFLIINSIHSSSIRLVSYGNPTINFVRLITTMDTNNNPSVRPPYLRSCMQECSEPVQAKVTGSIPSWVKGYLLRNGPGLRKVGKDEYRHLFDGLALIHQFEIKNGSVNYRNKFLRSEAYLKNMKANRIVVSDFGTREFPDPCLNILQRYMAFFSLKKFTDNDAVSIYPVGDNLYASTESTLLRRIDPTNIDSKEQVDVSKFVAVNTQTAHPHIDNSGVVYNLGSNFTGKGSYNLMKIDPKSGGFSKAEILCSIPVKHRFYPSYYHSFCFTDDYIIFIEQPLVTSIPSLLFNHFLGNPYCNALQWKPKHKNRFIVISKKDGKIISDKYVSEAFAFFHTINAYQEDNHIVCDICCYNDGHIVNALFAECLADVEQKAKEGKIHETKYGQSLQSQARRFVIPLNTSSSKPNENLVKLKSSSASAYLKNDHILIKHEPLTPKASNMSEMPQINYSRWNGKKYSYFYSLTRRDDFQTQLMKCNVVDKSIKTWCEEKSHPSEPIFVPRPNSTQEDDGVVLSAVLTDNSENKGFLLVLDAKNFKEIARADFETPSAITSDFHGMFWNRNI